MKKNILLITSDQQHFNTLGLFNKDIKTPNLDRLARKGVVFDRAYCSNPTCTPSRASIITGLYPSQHGAWTLGTKLSEDIPTIGDIMHKNGMKTALIGKAHFQPLASTDEYPSLEAYPILQDLEFWKKFNDNEKSWYGFDHCELARNHTDEPHVGQHYALWLEEKGCTNWRDYFRKPTGKREHVSMDVWDIPEEYHYDNWIAERSNAMLEKYTKEDKPFFLWSSFFDPHPDYIVPEPFYSMYDPDQLDMDFLVEGELDDKPEFFRLTQEEKDQFEAYRETGYAIHGMHPHIKNHALLRKQKAVYYGMITMMDKYIGKILDKVDELGIAENTLIVFTSDHGHFIGQHGLSAKGPFMYEDMIKIPMIVSGKEIPEGTVNHAMLSLVDLAPTFLDYLGIQIPAYMTGKNQLEVWENKKTMVRDHIICEDHHEPTTIHLKTYVNQRYKITVYFGSKEGELYDLKEDPKELKNLWKLPEYKGLKDDLIFRYIWAELGKEVMWMPRIADA